MAQMYDPLFSTPDVTHALSDREFLRTMLRFEHALAGAEEECGEIPAGVAGAIAKVDIDSFDLAALAQQALSAGNLCIPFVKMLTSAVNNVDPAAAAYVHWGVTSQDVIDTALLLQISTAWKIVVADLSSLCSTLAERIQKLRHTVMPGRTWLQQGPPVTMGLKLATWLDALQRQRERMQEARPRIFVLQFGGAVGTLAPLGDRGLAIATALAARLELGLPNVPWHTQRDRIAEIATTFGILSGTLGKIGRDVSLLMQTEVAEFFEAAGEGKGGSSTMPHKRNPVGCAVMLSAAARTPGLVATILSAMVQEHERGVGGWHAEWETITEIVRLTAGSLARCVEIVTAGTADSDAMLANLERLRGAAMAEAASFALARSVGKREAHEILERVSHRAMSSGSSLLQELSKEPTVEQHLSLQDISELLNPSNYLGSTQTFIDIVLRREATWRDHAKN